MKNNNELVFTGERLIPEFNEGTAFYYEHIARYLFCCQFVKDKIVLDAGSGSGYGTHILASQGSAKHVIGVDFSKKAINYSIKKYGKRNIIFNVDDIEILSTIKDKSIDVIINFEVIEHLKYPEKFLSQTKRVIKDKGIVIISTPNKLTYPSGNKFHIKEYTPSEFTKLLRNFFANVKIIPQNFRLSQEIVDRSNTDVKIDPHVKEKFYISRKDSIETENILNNSEYIIAICSNTKLQNITSLSMSMKKVDHFDLSKGLISLSKQYSAMHLYGKSLETTVENLKTKLIRCEKENLYYKNSIEEIDKLKTELINSKEELNYFYTEYGEFIAKYSELFPNVNLTEIPNLVEFASQNYINKTSYEPTFYKDFYSKVSSSKTYRLWQLFSKVRNKIRRGIK